MERTILMRESIIAMNVILFAIFADLADSFAASADASAHLTARSFNSSLFLSFSKFSCSLTKPTKDNPCSVITSLYTPLL